MNKTISIQELNDIKKDIEEFMQTIKKRSNLINYHQIDNDFFCFLSKHIIFLNIYITIITTITFIKL